MKILVRWFSRPGEIKTQQGQNLVEMSIVTPFMLILLLALFEMGQVFYAYVAMVNAARDGSIYASLHPTLTTTCPSPIPQVGSSGYSTMSEDCKAFADRISADTIAALLDSRSLTIARPVAPTVDLNLPITVTISYQLSTFSSNMSMPFFGRMGLPNFYNLSYSMAMPIRDAP